MSQIHRAALLLGFAMTIGGCDDRASQVAQEAAQRQAQQNLEMARVNQGVLQVTEQVHRERTELDQRRDDLESERRTIAGMRRTESGLAAIVSAGGALLAALFALALAWTMLAALPRSDDSAELLCELLASDLSAESPQFIEPLTLPAGDAPAALTHDPPQPQESP